MDLLIVYIISGLIHATQRLDTSHILVTPTGQEIKIEIADTPQQREQGLSYVKSMPPNTGMIFLFDRPGNYPFWMKGMNFSLDIIWLKHMNYNKFSVVTIHENIPPNSYPQLFNSNNPADAVLEINAGTAKVLGIKEGEEQILTFIK